MGSFSTDHLLVDNTTTECLVLWLAIGRRSASDYVLCAWYLHTPSLWPVRTGAAPSCLYASNGGSHLVVTRLAIVSADLRAFTTVPSQKKASHMRTTVVYGSDVKNTVINHGVVYMRASAPVESWRSGTARHNPFDELLRAHRLGLATTSSVQCERPVWGSACGAGG